jgi:hypothetical protein
MLRQCVGPKQKDWVSKLPAIEFAMNSTWSETTGYSPFFLNNGHMPRPVTEIPIPPFDGGRNLAGKDILT